MFLQNVLNVLVQIANKMGLQKKLRSNTVMQHETNEREDQWRMHTQLLKYWGLESQIIQ
jgi:hypothetical protein